MLIFKRSKLICLIRTAFGFFIFLFILNVMKLLRNQKEIVFHGFNDTRFIVNDFPTEHKVIKKERELPEVSSQVGMIETTLEATINSSAPCEINMSKLRKRQKVITDVGDFRFLQTRLHSTELGGRYRPNTCKPTSRIALIVPFRDRDTHLKIFFYNVIPKLQRQMIDFTVFVVEQAPDTNFNRGMMRNIGFLEANKLGDFDCFVFNDVDTIMEDDRNLIKCGKENVRHLVTGVDRDKYKLKYSTLVGGIIAFTKEQFIKVNGYSNFFFMWGAEDDEIEQRIKNNGLKIERPSAEIGFVTTLKHQRDPEIKSRFDILWSRTNKTAKVDGLNSVKYTVKLIEKRKLFTWIYVGVDEKETLKELHVPIWSKKRKQ